MYLKHHRALHTFVYRTPLFSTTNFWAFLSQAESFDLNNTYVSQLIRSELFREALKISSPELWQILERYLAGEKFEKNDLDKITASFYKYIARAHTRCTPFGIYASCLTGKIEKHSIINIQGQNSIKRKLRVDMGFVGDLIVDVLEKHSNREALVFYPNTSIYKKYDKLRYIEYRSDPISGRSYHAVEIDDNPYVNTILNQCEKGGNIRQVAKSIVEEDISYEDALAFVHSLIDNQILVSNLEPKMTGAEYFDEMLRLLSQMPNQENLTNILSEVKGIAEEYNRPGEGNKLELLESIYRHLKTVLPHRKGNDLVQVDSFREGNAELGINVVQAIKEGCELLYKLAPPKSNKILDDFKKKFLERYENREVPLVEILDSEMGLDFGDFPASGNINNPLLNNIPIISETAPTSEIIQPSIHDIKWDLYETALITGQTSVEIPQKAIDELHKKQTAQYSPDLMWCFAKIYASSEKEINEGKFSFQIPYTEGHSVVSRVARFCHLDESIYKVADDLLKKMTQFAGKDKIVAEIIHLPETRMGNVLIRPAFLEYELVYLGNPSVAREYQINIDDLLVSLSDGRLVLRSKRLNKEIVPCLNSAYNFILSKLPIYQFLCLLQYDKPTGVQWDWGGLSERPFLPRVTYKKQILTKAIWVLKKNEVNESCGNEKKITDLRLLGDYLKQRKIPRWVLMIESDNELLLDTHLPICLNILIKNLNKFDFVRLSEFLGDTQNTWVVGKDGKYDAEFMLFFEKKNEPETQHKPLVSKQEISLKRSFSFGEEWLYMKIYTGEKTADTLLTDFIKEISERLIQENKIKKWFFVRYHDTEPHIRLRYFNDENPIFWQHVIEMFKPFIQDWTNDKIVHRVVFDKYEREIERYGEEKMEYCEELFYYHSVVTVQILSLLSGDEGENLRWKILIKGIDILLSDFGYDLPRKRKIAERMYSDFEHEFGIGKTTHERLSLTYRNFKNELLSLLSPIEESQHPYYEAFKYYRAFPQRYYQIVQKLIALTPDCEQQDTMLYSIIHMFVNRTLNSRHRKQELVLYYLLSKSYDTIGAIQKIKKNEIE